MVYESSRDARSDVARPVPPTPARPLPARTYFQRRLRQPWVAARLRTEVAGLMRHTEALRQAAVGPPDTLVVSLRNARSAVEGLRTELAVWGLTERDERSAGTDMLLRYDVVEELARHGITFDPGLTDRLARLRRRLIEPRAGGRPDPAEQAGGPGGDLERLLDDAVTAIDDLLETQDVHDDRWIDRARTILTTIWELIVTLIVGIIAVAFTVLAVDEPLAKEMTKKVIEILTTAASLHFVHSARDKLRGPDIAAVLDAADRGVRDTAGRLTAIMRRLGPRRPLSTRETQQVRNLAACLTGHVWTAERLIELADCADWPAAAEYVQACTRLRDLCDTAAESDPGSWFARRRVSRTLVPSLAEAVREHTAFSLPDHLPLKTPS
ncbi:hypothetical protein AB0K18_05200 [Nonomuraea sp. NPDC049421]|uniref:hypothetical protein n=1 Tax=Nonomuraea sp. NPDC049421 TaxID=3155275 RepID=UPI0034358CDB